MAAKHLIVSSFPPSRCGVATYAAEHLDALRHEGITVRRASPLQDSEADFHFDVSSLPGALKWCWFCLRSRFDGVHLHYVDIHYFRWGYKGRMLRHLLRLIQSLSLIILTRRSRFSSAIIHEIPHYPGLDASFRATRSQALSGFDEVLFHTESMRDACRLVFPALRTDKCRVIEHHRFMKRRYPGDKDQARKDLGLPPDKVVFLCLGFIQQSKGFDDVIRAFASTVLHQSAELHVVGSSRAKSATETAYAESLLALCRDTEGCHLHQEYLTDDMFDCWLAAVDVVFLPYRGVVSSGVGARAGLYQTPVVIRSLPNLIDQFPHAMRFKDESDLSEILRNAAMSPKTETTH